MVAGAIAVFVLWSVSPRVAVRVALVSVLGLLGAAVYTWKRDEAFLHIEAMPVAIGKMFRGEIETRLTRVPPDGFWLVLRCIRSEADAEVTECQDELLLQEVDVRMTERGVRVPFAFEMPTRGRHTQSDVRWTLEVTARRFSVAFPIEVEGRGDVSDVRDELVRPFGGVREMLRDD